MEAEILSKYWEREVSSSSLEKLSEAARRDYCYYARALAELYDSGEPILPVKLLKKVLEKFSLSIDEKIFQDFNIDDAFEIWRTDGRFVASSNQFYKLTSWSLDDLIARPRADLFQRDEASQRSLDESIMKACVSGACVNDSCPPHIVYERKVSSVAVEVALKSVAPVRSLETDEICAVLAVVRFKKLSE